MEDYKNYVQELEKMINILNKNDYQFIVRVYTIVLQYLKKRGRY